MKLINEEIFDQLPQWFGINNESIKWWFVIKFIIP